MRSSLTLHTTVQRASRARLIRFLAFCDRGRQAWKGPLDGDTDQQLRDAAFVVADHWYVVRRERAFWRAAHTDACRSLHVAAADHIMVRIFRGAALDAWLTNATPSCPPLLIAAE